MTTSPQEEAPWEGLPPEEPAIGPAEAAEEPDDPTFAAFMRDDFGAAERGASLERQAAELLLKRMGAPAWVRRSVEQQSLNLGQAEGLTFRSLDARFGHLFPVRFVATRQRYVSLDVSDCFRRLAQLPVVREFLDARDEFDDGRSVALVARSVSVPKKKAAGILVAHDGSLSLDFRKEGRQVLLCELPKGRGVVCLERLDAWAAALAVKLGADADWWTER
jgi:hypothetical protein